MKTYATLALIFMLSPAFALEPQKEAELKSLAEKGNVIAAWQLAQDYLNRKHEKQIKPAFSLLIDIVKQKSESHPLSAEGRAVAQSLVTLGKLYTDGRAPDSLRQDFARAKELFQQAAVHYGDSEAQYQLASLLLLGATGVDIDIKQAMRWLTLAANKSHPEAQAELGYLLFQGKLVPRQAALGLMYLTIAREAAPEIDKFIKDKYNECMANASDDERREALKLLEKWLTNRG